MSKLIDMHRYLLMHVDQLTHFPAAKNIVAFKRLYKEIMDLTEFSIHVDNYHIFVECVRLLGKILYFAKDPKILASS